MNKSCPPYGFRLSTVEKVIDVPVSIKDIVLRVYVDPEMWDWTEDNLTFPNLALTYVNTSTARYTTYYGELYGDTDPITMKYLDIDPEAFWQQILLSVKEAVKNDHLVLLSPQQALRHLNRFQATQDITPKPYPGVLHVPTSKVHLNVIPDQLGFSMYHMLEGNVILYYSGPTRHKTVYSTKPPWDDDLSTGGFGDDTLVVKLHDEADNPKITPYNHTHYLWHMAPCIVGWNHAQDKRLVKAIFSTPRIETGISKIHHLIHRGGFGNLTRLFEFRKRCVLALLDHLVATTSHGRVESIEIYYLSSESVFPKLVAGAVKNKKTGTFDQNRYVEEPKDWEE